MLTLASQIDDCGIENAIFGDSLASGERVILLDGEVPCGVAVFRLADNRIYLDKVGILPHKLGNSIGDFFMRSLLYKFSFYHMDIVVGWVHDYFYKFGLVDCFSGMIARGGVVNFPSSCGAKCHGNNR